MNLSQSRLLNYNSSIPSKIDFLNKLKSIDLNTNEEKLILYEGEWQKDLPHGNGTLSFYLNITNIQLSNFNKYIDTQ